MDEWLWNLLHDGTVERAEGSVPGEVIVTVSIPYIREMFPGEVDKEHGGLSVALQACTTFQYEPYEGPVVEQLAEIGSLELWILSAVPGYPLRVSAGRGDLVLAYSSAVISLDSGEPISLQDLGEASERYWTAFEARANGRTAP